MRVGKLRIRWQDIQNAPAIPEDAEPSDPAIQTHITGTGSPHTASGVGADAAGTAAGAVAAHALVHPAPTTRDSRNEAADAAIQSHVTGTGSPHTASGIGLTPTAEVPYTNVQAGLQAVGAIGRALTFDFDNGGSALETGVKVVFPCLPVDFTPTRWSVQCSANARTGVAASASVAFEITVGVFATDALPAGATGGTQPSVTTAIGATATADFTDVVWSAGQAVMATLTGTPTAKWATLVIEGTVTA